MNDPEQPGIELAPLPRDRIGPFVILGVAKDADAETIERHWAQRVLWARQGKTQATLEDIHWAREVLRDPQRRLAADIDSLNQDTSAGDLRRIVRHFHLDPPQAAWSPVELDAPPLTSDQWPDPESERAKLPAPDVPLELPAVHQWLEAWAAASLDPWSTALPHSSPDQGESDE